MVRPCSGGAPRSVRVMRSELGRSRTSAGGACAKSRLASVRARSQAASQFSSISRAACIAASTRQVLAMRLASIRAPTSASTRNRTHTSSASATSSGRARREKMTPLMREALSTSVPQRHPMRSITSQPPLLPDATMTAPPAARAPHCTAHEVVGHSSLSPEVRRQLSPPARFTSSPFFAIAASSLKPPMYSPRKKTQGIS